MKIKWLVDCEIEICEDPDSMNIIVESRKAGSTDDVEIVGYGMRYLDGDWREDKNLPQFQFGDGSVTLAVSQEWFEEIK